MRQHDPVTIAHRGYSAVAPENTFRSFESALLAGADMLEMDTSALADGATVVMHDDTVDRTTDGTGPLAELDTAGVRRLDAGAWFAPTAAGERVPLLGDVLELLSRRDGQLLLEIKPGATAQATGDQVRQVREAGLADRVIVQSFDPDVVRAAREADPGMRRGFLVETLPEDPVAIARELDVMTFNPLGTLLRDRPDLVGLMHAAGVSVMPWTINDPRDWAALHDLGVDGIITDRPGAHLGFRAARRLAAVGSAVPVPGGA